MTVTAPDDYTVQFVLPVPFAPFLRSMGNTVYPKHILEPYVDAGTFEDVWGINANPSEVIGTGPFTIVQYAPGDRLTLQRNPGYWMKDSAGNSLPYVDEVVYHIVADFEEELALFQAGEADMHGVLGEEYPTLEPLQEEGNFTLYRRGPGFGTTFLAFNMNQGTNADGEPYVRPEALAWFSNREFRQAVAHSVDRNTIVSDILGGLGYPQWSSISPAAGDFHNHGRPDGTSTTFRERTRCSTVLAGRIRTATAFARTATGTRSSSRSSRTWTTPCANVQRGSSQVGLEAIGIRADFRLVEFGELVSQLTSTYDWETIVIGFTGGPDPYGGIGFWHSSADLHLWYPFQDGTGDGLGGGDRCAVHRGQPGVGIPRSV